MDLSPPSLIWEGGFIFFCNCGWIVTYKGVRINKSINGGHQGGKIILNYTNIEKVEMKYNILIFMKGCEILWERHY